jgi:hypothetical protein
MYHSTGVVVNSEGNQGTNPMIVSYNANLHTMQQTA